MTKLNDVRNQYIDKLLAEKSLYHFIKQGWSYADPSTYQDNWHIKFLADHLQALYADKLPCSTLLINIPPGFGKSLIASVFTPAWLWINSPEMRFLTGSKTEELAIRDSRRARNLLISQWYQTNWGTKWIFCDDENRKRGYENNLQGFRNIFSIKGNVTGKRGHRIIDDPNDAAESYNQAQLKATNEWYGSIFSTRVNPLEKTKTVVIMQRIAQGDFSDFILQSLKNDVLHICLPMEFDPDRKCKTPIGEDPRTEEGELLWKAVKPEFIEQQKLLLGRLYAAQYQQMPSPLEGSIFKATDFIYYKHSELPANFDRIISSTDVAEKTSDANDYSVISIWGIIDQRKYLLDLWRGRLEYPDLRTKYVGMIDRWKPHQNLVEDKSSGTPLIQELKRCIRYPLTPIKPKGSKEARAEATRPQFIGGNIFFPESNEWINQYIEEMLLFPAADHDDQVDVTTQLLLYLHTNNAPMLRML